MSANGKWDLIRHLKF